MEREAAEKRIQELRDLVRYHSRLYYELDNPELDDYEYDLLYHELLDLEEKYPDLKTPDSPTQKVGGAAVFLTIFDFDAVFPEFCFLWGERTIAVVARNACAVRTF